MEVFFEIPGVGELMLEHSFYQLDGEPILFVCKDAKGARFLCSCYQMDENWVIGQVEAGALLELIDDKITIREVFEQRCRSKWTAAWDGEEFRYSTEVPDDVLPQKGAFLELPREKGGKYRESLAQEMQMSPHDIVENYVQMFTMTAKRPVCERVPEMDVPMKLGSIFLGLRPQVSWQGFTGKESQVNFSANFPAAA